MPSNTASCKTLIILLLILVLIATGCITSGSKDLDKKAIESKAPLVSAPPDSGPDSNDLEDQHVNCSVVTQYGGRVISCAGAIPSENKGIHFEGAPSRVEGGITGVWKISYGNLSTFSHLNFIGEAEFKADGTYSITTHPVEFNPSEGIIEYIGSYDVEGNSITGSGSSKIYQNEEVFGTTAMDTLTAFLDESELHIEGSIDSVSSLHEGGGGGNASFTFVLERNEME